MSATEWMASASIDEAPVTKNPANFATAMPRFARNAAAIALLLPSCTPLPAGGDRGQYARPRSAGA